MSRADHLGVPVKREDGNVGDARAHHHVHRSPPPFRVGVILYTKHTGRHSNCPYGNTNTLTVMYGRCDCIAAMVGHDGPPPNHCGSHDLAMRVKPLMASPHGFIRDSGKP